MYIFRSIGGNRLEFRNHNSAVWLDQWLENRGSIPRRDRDINSTSQHPNLLWSPPSLLSNGYRWYFPDSKEAGAWS